MDPLTFVMTCMCGGVIIVGAVMLLFLGVSIPAVLVGGGASASYNAPEKFLKFLYLACGLLILYAILGETIMPELFDDDGDGPSSRFEVFEVFIGYFLGVVIYHTMSHYWDKWEIVESGKSSWAWGGYFLWGTSCTASYFLVAESARAFGLSDQLPESPFILSSWTWEEFYLRNIFDIWGQFILCGGIIGILLVRHAVSLSRK